MGLVDLVVPASSAELALVFADISSHFWLGTSRALRLSTSHADLSRLSGTVASLGPQQYQATAVALAGLAAVAVAWSFRINTNLFYVVFLSCSFIAVQLLMTRLSLRLSLLAFFLFFLFYSPGRIPAPPEQSKLMVPDLAGKTVPAGATRSYRFLLAPLRDRKSECGSLQRADIYVHLKFGDGADRAAVLSVDQGRITGQDETPFYAGYTILRGHAEFAGELPDEVVVGLHNPGQKPFEIYLGAEVAKGRVYPEAVFMKFETPECLVVAHSHAID